MYSAYIAKFENLQSELKKSLDFIDWKKQVKKDSTVFVKPNFTFPYYKKGITSSPNLIQTLLETLKDRADRVILGESDGGNHSFSADTAFKGHRMNEICKQTGVELVNLSLQPSRFIEDLIQKRRVKVQLPHLLLDEVDCVVSVPVLKAHVMTQVSLGMKNLWGCYPDTMRGLYHKKLSYKLALITKLLKPKIILIDGSFALTEHGPLYGKVLKNNVIISSNNPVVSDSLGAEVMGISPTKCKHITVAEQAGLGIMDLSQVKINEDWREYIIKFSINKTFIDMLATIPFNSEIFAKLIMDSPATPIINKIAPLLKTTKEREVAIDILQGKRNNK